jgi:hypothetical protein
MKYVKTYESFKINKKEEELNEEFLGDVFKAAKGALKNFLGGLLAPFKSLKDDFKKGLKFEEIKTKMNGALDTMLKNATANINKAKDEGEINQMIDAFMKEIDEKMAEFDKEIKAVKESKIYEGKVQDALIGGRVLFGMLKDEYNKVKADFDKKFAAAKDLNGKKQMAVARIKAVVDGFKKKVNDEKLVKAATDKYKTDNKIEGGGNKTVILDWGDVEVEIKLPVETGGRYEIIKSGSKKLVLPDNRTLYCDISGEAKKGEKVEFKKITVSSEGNKPFQIDGKDSYTTGNLERIVLDGKEVDSYKFNSTESSSETPDAVVDKELTPLKNTDKMKKVAEVLPKIIAKIDDEETMKKVTDALA